MGIYFGHITSLWVMTHRNGWFASRSDRNANPQSLVDTKCTKEEVYSAGERLAKVARAERPEEFFVLVGTGKQRRHARGIYPSVWGRIPARGAFFDLGAGIYISTPEFCFLQMARECSLIKLIEFGFCLCGFYYPTYSKRGFVDVKPLTTPERIREFLNGCGGMHGVKKARRAAKVLIGGSRSPMETAAAMVFCLPSNLGGYGFGGAELNKRVYLSGQARRIWGKGCLYLDICWRESRLGLEYNSADFHTNVVQDESRRLALGRDGWRLQFAASQQLWQAAQRDEVARRIGSVLRMRTRRPTRRTLRAREYLIAELKPQKEADSDTWRKPRWAFADVG